LIGGRRELVELLADQAILPAMEPVYNQFYGDRQWADDLIEKSKLSEEIRGHGLMEKGYIKQQEVIKAVALQYGITADELLRGVVPDAMMVLMYLLNVHTPSRLVEIGQLFRLKKFTVAQRLWRFKKHALSNTRTKKIIGTLEKKLLR
jgi:chromosomal replication initiation ATPase DnaA